MEKQSNPQPRLLGVTFDQELRWKEHVQQAIKRNQSIYRSGWATTSTARTDAAALPGMCHTSSGLCIDNLARPTQRQKPPTTPEHSTENIADLYTVGVQNSFYHESRSGSTNPPNTPPSPPPSPEQHHKTPHASSRQSHMEYISTSSEAQEKCRVIRSLPTWGSIENHELGKIG